jgi:hypothetical protein
MRIRAIEDTLGTSVKEHRSWTSLLQPDADQHAPTAAAARSPTIHESGFDR